MNRPGAESRRWPPRVRRCLAVLEAVARRSVRRPATRRNPRPLRFTITAMLSLSISAVTSRQILIGHLELMVVNVDERETSPAAPDARAPPESTADRIRRTVADRAQRQRRSLTREEPTREFWSTLVHPSIESRSENRLKQFLPASTHRFHFAARAVGIAHLRAPAAILKEEPVHRGHRLAARLLDGCNCAVAGVAHRSFVLLRKHTALGEIIRQFCVLHRHQSRPQTAALDVVVDDRRKIIAGDRTQKALGSLPQNERQKSRFLAQRILLVAADVIQQFEKCSNRTLTRVCFRQEIAPASCSSIAMSAP